MNFCELELAKTVQRSGDVEKVARELYSTDSTISIDDTITYLNQLLDIMKSQGSVFNSLGFQEFFRVDGKIDNHTYIKVRQNILQRVSDSIFGDIPALTDFRLNDNLESLRRSAIKKLNANPVKLHYQYSYQKNIAIKEQNAEAIANYLIAYHLPIVVQAVAKNLVKFDNGKFVFDIQTKVRTDWNSDQYDDKPAELSSAVRMMLGVTPMLDIEGNRVGTFCLTTNSFFFAISELFENLERDFTQSLRNKNTLVTPWYQKILDNPLELINYFLSSDFEKYIETDSSLSGNILRSVVNKWIKHDGSISSFAQACLDSSESAYYNPLHLLITSAVKNTSNTFLDREFTPRYRKVTKTVGKRTTHSDELIGVSKSITVLDKRRSLLSEAGARAMESISKEELSGLLPENPNDLNTTHIKQVLKKLFPYQPISIPENDSRLGQWKTHFNIFYNFINSSASSLETIISAKADSATTDSAAESYYWIVRNALNTNPYLIKGTQSNNLESQVPVYGLRTVANSIPQNIANLKTAVNKKNSIYYRLGQTHVSPYEHSAIFKGEIPLPKVVYNSSFRYNSTKDVAPIKEYRDLTAKEMAHLSIYYDYLDAGSSIRIQPITVSDKTRVPFFEFDKNIVRQGRSNDSMLADIELLYKQSIINTINDFYRVIFGNVKFNQDAKEVSWEKLEEAITEIDLSSTTKETLWAAAERYNTLNGTNITFAEHLDFTSNKDGSITISKSAAFYTKAMSSGDFWKNQFRAFLEDLSTICPEIKIKNKDLSESIKELKEGIDAGDNSYKNSELYNYFVLHNYLTENVLAVTVGLPMSHKGSGDSWEAYDSKANLTMVKRMVALTATMHPCTKGLLGGLPSEIKTQTVDLGTTEMYTYSGNTPSGSGFTAKLDISDGIIYGTRAGDNLLKASIGDVRPKGNMLKLLHHDFDTVKGYSRLVKCAEMSVDNAMIRTWDIHPDDAAEVKAFSPKNFMKLSFQNSKLDLDSFLENENTGELILVDYNDCELVPNVYRKFDSEVYKLNSIEYVEDLNKVEMLYTDGDNVVTVHCDLDLYSIWEAFGGAFSCDKDGNYNEGSQDALTILMNRVGFPRSTESIQSQEDVNQYLKTQSVFYIHTATAQKSLQPPTSTLEEALAGNGFTVKMGIDRLGIQLDADHSAEDSHIREISQLMSNLAEGGYVGDKAEKVYSRIQSLIQTSLNDLRINTFELSKLSESEQAQIHDFLGKKFSQIFKRKMADPEADVMGLANAIAVELQNKNLLIPISDRQHLSKYHTTVGSYFNKFIARAWTGRADVLMPGHNMLMVYEDIDGTVYMPGDYKIGEFTQPVRDAIRERMFNSDGTLKNSFVDGYRVTAHDVHPDTNYYIVNEFGVGELFVTSTYNKLMDLSNAILSGAKVVKAYNLPRNLKAKQVGIEITDSTGKREYHDIYFFNTHKKLAKCGQLLSKLSNKNTPVEIIEEFELFTGQKFTDVHNASNKLTALKRKYGTDLQNILTRIANNDFGDVENELGLLPLEEGITRTYRVHTDLDERITSNNYSHVWGHATFSEISQLKEKYFENRLRNVLHVPAAHSTILTAEGAESGVELFTMSSKCTFCVSDLEHIQSGALETPVVVDDENYRLDNSGRRMYMWPIGARLYTKNGHDIVFIPSDFEKNLEIITQSSYFSGYRSKQEYQIPVDYYGTFQENSNNFEEYVKGLSIAQYNSWLKTNHCIEARIPSQSLSFAMHLKTVGYCPWETNISICSNAHVFNQGSDFDIDKIYAMMYSVNGSGILKQSEEYTFTITEESGENISDESRIISTLLGEHIGKWLNTKTSNLAINTIFATSPEDIKELYKNVGKLFLGVNKLSGTTLVVSVQHVLTEAFRIANISKEQYSTQGVMALNWLNSIIEELNKYAKVLQDQKLDQYGGLQNNTLDQMLDIFDDVRVLLPSTTPTTMYPINSVVDDLNLEGNYRNHLNPASAWYVNQTAMVGKDGVGITASAQKAMLALTQYNSMRFKDGEDLSSPVYFELPKEWQLYKHNGNYVNTKYFVNFVFPGQKVNRKTLESIYDWASKKVEGGPDLEIEPILSEFGIESIRIKGAQFGNEFVTLSIGMPIDTELATSINSAFISSATDNAKEMKLDLIGGHPLLLPAFMYGLTLGMPVDLLVRIFTDDEIKSWILNVRGNIFNGDPSNVRLSSKVSDIKDKVKQSVVKRLIKGGEILTALSRILSINQGMKVNVGEVQNWYLKLESNIDSAIPNNITSPSDGRKRFDAYEFFSLEDIKERRQYAKLRADSDLAFNVLDVIATVPHYFAMCQVPLVFKEVIENQSTDIRLLHGIMANDYFSNKFIDPKNISKYLRSINHLKIFEFLRQLDWRYESDTVYIGSRLQDTTEEEVTLTTAEAKGIYSLKKFIESNVINVMQERFPTNAFVANIQKVTRIMPEISKIPVKAYGISFNMTSPQNKDMADIVRLGFYELQDESVAGHSFGEWMFLYDLLVNHHDVGTSSFTNIFDSMINLEDKNSVITKYYDFVQKHDNPTNRPYSLETRSLIPVKMVEDADDDAVGMRTYCAGEVMPLRIDVESRLNAESYISKSALHRYYNNGNLFIFSC